MAGQGRPRSPKTVQSAEGGEGKDKRESLWLFEAPVGKIILQMHTLARTSQCWSRHAKGTEALCQPPPPPHTHHPTLSGWVEPARVTRWKCATRRHSVLEQRVQAEQGLRHNVLRQSTA